MCISSIRNIQLNSSVCSVPHHRITTANIYKSKRPSDIQRLVELASIAHCSPNIPTTKKKRRREKDCTVLYCCCCCRCSFSALWILTFHFYRTSNQHTYSRPFRIPYIKVICFQANRAIMEPIWEQNNHIAHQVKYERWVHSNQLRIIRNNNLISI